MLVEKFIAKQVVLYPNTHHSANIADEMRNINENINIVIVNTPEEARRCEDCVVVLIGYWNHVGVNDFCKLSGIDKAEIYLPYKKSFVIDLLCKHNNVKIDNLEFGVQNKAELVLVLWHEARDFVTQSAHLLSKKFRLTKIYFQGNSESPENKYFDQILNLEGDIKAIEYFFKNHSDRINICCLFLHGMDFWKVPYVSKLLSAKTKLITMTCDWLSSIIKDSAELEALANTSKDYITMERYAEIFALQHSDGIVMNYVGEIFNKVEIPRSRAITSCAFLSEEHILFFARAGNKKIKCCFFGTLTPDVSTSNIKIAMNLSGIFKSMVECYDIEIDVYSNYNIGLHRGDDPYGRLLKNKNFRIFGTVQHEELPFIAANYDFGLLVYNFFSGLSKEYFAILKDIIQAKFIVYLLSGIPVVLNSEFVFMSKIVKKFGCGIVVDYGDLDNIGRRILDADYDDLKAGVERFQMFYRKKNPAKSLSNFLENF